MSSDLWVRHLLHLSCSFAVLETTCGEPIDESLQTVYDAIYTAIGSPAMAAVHKAAYRVVGCTRVVDIQNAVWAVIRSATMAVSFDTVFETKLGDANPAIEATVDSLYQVIIEKYSEISEKLKIKNITWNVDEDTADFMRKLVEVDISKMAKKGQAYYLVCLEQILATIPPNVLTEVEELKKKWKRKIKFYELDKIYEYNSEILTVDFLTKMEAYSYRMSLLKPLWAIVCLYLAPYSIEEKLKGIIMYV